ncbi:MAG: HEAT repeat domain-containing protein [Proteobacteria bacterium]|nr:HEAT repeat domain-containing protein [Pseudomonadota bacterium]
MLKSLFNRDERRARSLQRAIAKAGNPRIKPDDRQPALQRLFDDGSDQAIEGLLRRFSFNYDTNLVSDEDEKDYVFEGLLSLGERVLPALRLHLSSSPSLSWGLRLLGEACSPQQKWEVLAEVLARYEPGYERDPSRKVQLIACLGAFDDPRVPAAIVPFLQDHDETVRFVTVEGLIARGNEAVAREPLLALLIDPEEESRRLKNRILQGFVATEWTVKGHRGTIEQQLPDDYVIDGKGRIRPKKEPTR